MTGWNLPPGCSVRDIEDAMGSERPCDVCGRWLDNCMCPECPTCHTVGDLRCYAEHGLPMSAFQIASKAEADEKERAEIAAENAYYQQLYVDDMFFESLCEGDLDTAIGWASR